VLRVDAPDLVAAATVGRRPGTHGLEADPSLVAERSPAWPLVPTASIGGLRRATTALDVVQGLVEAVALGLADAVEALERWAGHQMLVLGGGASASAGWRQLLADAIGRPLVWSQVSEASARGAALVAFERLGTPLPNVSPGEDLVHPDPDRAEAFALLRAAEPRPRFAASLGP
jgi:gluconokinase